MSVSGVSILSSCIYYNINGFKTIFTCSSQQLDHLEWLLNGVVFKNGTSGAIRLLLLIRPVTLSHAGHWECRAVFSDSTISSPVNAGTLTVYGECRYYYENVYNLGNTFNESIV